jgi:dephospho-CoA kinase
MKTLGLLGGVASGKSLVANKLQELGAMVLDADRAGHEVLRLPHIRDAARQRWGASIFAADGENAGEIDRKRLASIVFAGTDDGRRELEFLEKLTHPEIGRRLQEQLSLVQKQGVQVAVLDAPVMLKRVGTGFAIKSGILMHPTRPAWSVPRPAAGPKRNFAAGNWRRNPSSGSASWRI